MNKLGVNIQYFVLDMIFFSIYLINFIWKHNEIVNL